MRVIGNYGVELVANINHYLKNNKYSTLLVVHTIHAWRCDGGDLKISEAERNDDDRGRKKQRKIKLGGFFSDTPYL